MMRQKRLLQLGLFLLLGKLLFAQGYLALVGGGSEDYGSWSDAPYGWMVAKGDSGKVLVLSYRDESNWIPDYFLSLGAAQAQNLKIASTAQANDPAVRDEILSASVIFLKGGNQYEYYARWHNTLASQAIAQVYQNGGVIAGTSAGAMVLGEVVFTSQNGTVYPEEVLRDPYDVHVTLKDDFFDFLPGMLVDTHVIERGRVGRLAGFLARWNQDAGADLLAIGVDDRTALLVDPALDGEVAGSGAVTFLWQTPQSEVVCLSGQPLHFTYLGGCQLTSGFRFDLSSRSISYLPPGVVAVDPDPLPISPPPGDLWLQGGEDVAYQVAAGHVLDQFRQHYPAVEKLTILCDINSAAVSRANQYRDWLLAQGVDSVWVQSIYVGNVNNPAVLATVDAAQAFILTGNHELFVAMLLNGANDLSQHFQARTGAGVPVLAIGIDARMVSDRLVGAAEGSTGSLFYGNLKWVAGAALWPNTLVMSRAFDDHDYKENRVGGFFWGLFKSPKRLGILLDEHTTVLIGDSLAQVRGEAPAILVDASAAAYIDSSRFAFGSNPRQCVAFDSYTWHIIAPGRAFDWPRREPLLTAIDAADEPGVPRDFAITAAYPNPFNGQVQFRLQLTRALPVNIVVFDVLGRKVAAAQLQPAVPGEYRWAWSPEAGIASGVYVVKFRQGRAVERERVHYLK